MNWLKKISDTIKGSEDFSDIKSSTLRDILNGNILKKKFIQKHYALFILVAFLAFIYIDNRFYCETQVSREVKLKQQLKDIKYESLTISAQLTTLSRRTYVMNFINEKGLNLKESPYAPVIITEPDPEKDQELLLQKKEEQEATKKIENDTTIVEEYIIN
ncbi:MAG TPA: FtsL-like putative cell division protein [Paludibacteraceae bacterium]|mgnify:CR=1 FL=1|nr:FtsL-like putative cell division protein [Paludibacteraceae bacterium]HPT42374.1 FtsL-like putative cell division protein [Paludibacteraceae bacterium]